MRLGSVRFLRPALAAGLVAGTALTGAAQQIPAAPAEPAPPTAVKPAPLPAAPAADASVVAFIGQTPVTRQQLGEFLIERGGAEKLDLLLNKMIIEAEATRLGITVTDTEMKAALDSDIKGLPGNIQRKEFLEQFLPRYNKTYFEWMEDVIRPRLLLTKMVEGTVKVTPEELQRQFEIEYGEKRRCQIIIWPLGDDLKAIQDQYATIRKSDAEFDRAAIKQALPGLASSEGKIRPIARHTYASDPIIVETAFKLQPPTAGKPAEISGILKTSQGYIVLKLLEVIPPDAKVDRAKVLPALEKQALEEKLVEAIPAKFQELAKKANPQSLYTGPSRWTWTTTPTTAPAPMPAK